MATFTAGQVLTASDLTTAFNTATITAVTSTSHTFGTANAGELVTLSNASGGTATIPANSTWGAATGTIVGVLNAGTAGSWTIGTAAGVTLNASSASLAPLASGTLVKTATNTWYFLPFGSGGDLTLLRSTDVTATTGSPTITTFTDSSSIGWTVYKFTAASGSITFGKSAYADVLCVGGGGGYWSTPNVWGCGGYVTPGFTLMPASTLTITVGAGGAAAANGGYSRIGTTIGAAGGPAGKERGAGQWEAGNSNAGFTSTITGSSDTYGPSNNTAKYGGGGSSDSGAAGVVIIRVRT